MLDYSRSTTLRPARARARKTILVIEDEVLLSELLAEELERLGYDVVIAHDGRQGLERISASAPDLIICDRAMPKMTGFELLDRLRGIYPQHGDIPFIFLTALTDQRDRDVVEPLLPYAYLTKPLDFDVLRQTIEKALG